MKISYEVNRYGHILIYQIQDESKTVYIQTDWDYPSVATTFGWSLRDVQVQNAGYYGVLCAHEDTDGTVQCKGCGLQPSTFISDASDWLGNHEGTIVDDPGYFGSE
jgi:hypothetical protein